MPRAPETPRPSLAELAAYHRLHPDASIPDVARAYKVPERWVRRHWQQVIAQVQPSVTIAGPTISGGRGTPAEMMDESDRMMALGTVRRIYKAIRIAVDRLLKQLEKDKEPGIPVIDKDATQSLLNLQRIAQSMVDAHPGLLQLGGDEEAAGAEMSEDELLGHLSAIERGEA